MLKTIIISSNHKQLRFSHKINHITTVLSVACDNFSDFPYINIESFFMTNKKYTTLKLEKQTVYNLVMLYYKQIKLKS